MNLKEIEEYICEIQDSERNFRHQNLQVVINESKKEKIKRVKKYLYFLILSIIDLFSLIILIKFRKNIILRKRIVYTGRGSCMEINGKLEDRIVKPLFSDNILFINSQKESRISKINNQKVFNLGTLVKFISLLCYRGSSNKMRVFKAYTFINNIILKSLKGNEVYVICLWEMNTLSIIFSKYRQNYKLIKIQHGSMINYPPYIKPAPIKIADLIYVRNNQTIEFLKSHLCSLYTTEYKILPYPVNNLNYVPGTHILYASTIETNGIHPVFIEFLKSNRDKNLHVILRLHPRERDKEMEFASFMQNFKCSYEFDNSKNWLEHNTIKNLIVISPWSSTLEEAYDNGFTAIAIDPIGKKRFEHYIDNYRFFFSENIFETIEIIKSLENRQFI